MNDIKVLQEIKDDLSVIKESIKERNICLASEQYSVLKDNLRVKEKIYTRDSETTAYAPHAISEILHKSFSARKNTKDLSKIAHCIADADDYIDYYINRTRNN